MKTITIKVSDSDYDDLVKHLAKNRLGRCMVAVVEAVSENLIEDIGAWSLVEDQEAADSDAASCNCSRGGCASSC